MLFLHSLSSQIFLHCLKLRCDIERAPRCWQPDRAYHCVPRQHSEEYSVKYTEPKESSVSESQNPQKIQVPITTLLLQCFARTSTVSFSLLRCLCESLKPIPYLSLRSVTVSCVHRTAQKFPSIMTRRGVQTDSETKLLLRQLTESLWDQAGKPLMPVLLHNTYCTIKDFTKPFK